MRDTSDAVLILAMGFVVLPLFLAATLTMPLEDMERLIEWLNGWLETE